jgi:PAS domain S-box-containing protein
MAPPDDLLQQELAELRARCAELERERDELRQELATLRPRNALLNTLLSNLPIVVYMLDREGRFVLGEGKGLEPLKIKPDQFRGLSLFSLYPPESPTWKNHARALQGESLAYLVNDNPQGIFYDAWVAPMYDEQGQIEGVLSVALDVDQRQRAFQELERNQILLSGLLENTPALIAVKDAEQRYLLANQRFGDYLGYPVEQIIGRSLAELHWNESGEQPGIVDEVSRGVLERGESVQRELTRPEGEDPHTYLFNWFPIRDRAQTAIAVGTVAVDISDIKRAEQQRASLQQQMIEMQRTALREISTPLIPLAERVVLMPLVGLIDDARAQQIMEALLQGVSEHQAEVALLDITGVGVMDTQAADALLRTARAARLLGAQVVLTGISGEIAQTLTTLGADLRDIITLNNLQSGISFALRSGAARARA